MRVPSVRSLGASTARSIKGAWEALVSYVNPEKTAEIRKIAAKRPMVRGPHALESDSTCKEGVHGVTRNRHPKW